METKAKPSAAVTWYERIWNKIELVNTNPELSPYLDVDKFPDYQANLAAKLIGQSLPSVSLTELKTITPEKLGVVLGTQCATLYALGEFFAPLENNPEAVKQGEKHLAILQSRRDEPAVSNLLHAGGIADMMIKELAKDFPRFEKTVHGAFKAALDQPNYQEAAGFFQGFARGISKPGFKDGKLAMPTDATTLQSKMFMHAEQIAKMKNVKGLRAFLLKNGFTEQTLGDDSRLEKFCSRLGYAPGKKKRKSPKIK